MENRLGSSFILSYNLFLRIERSQPFLLNLIGHKMRKLLFALITFTTTSLSALPQAVVFDFGGVMTFEAQKDLVVQFLQNTLHLTPKEFSKANQEKHKAIKEGKTDLEFWLAYANENHIVLPSDWSLQFMNVMKEAIAVNPEMYELVETLKRQNLQVALLSNINERLGKLIDEFGFYAPFNPCLLSYQLGVEKPDLQAFKILLNSLPYEANDIIFIDDRLDNVVTAQSLGIDGIHFTSYQKLKSDLAKRGISLK